MTTIENSTISSSTFKYNVLETSISDATIDRCKFQGLVDDVTISGTITKCQFEGLSNGLVIDGPLDDMTIQVNIEPNSAHYVQKVDIPSQLDEISLLEISTSVVPRLAEYPHKECFINIVQPNNRDAFIVQLSTDDTNPRGIILMFFPGEIAWDSTLEESIPKGYAICDGRNGTPDLTGKFIRMVKENETIGHKENDTLQYNDETDRYDSIIITEYNLPDHQHRLNLTFDLAEINGQTNSALDDYMLSIPNYSTVESIVDFGGESTTSVYSIAGTSYDTEFLAHSHSFSANVNINPNVEWLQNENFRQDPIKIEPDAYALIFIMKL